MSAPSLEVAVRFAPVSVLERDAPAHLEPPHHRLDVVGTPLTPLLPRLISVRGPTFIGPYWMLLTEQRDLITDGTTIAPMNLMKCPLKATSLPAGEFLLRSGAVAEHPTDVFFLGGHANHYHALFDDVTRLLMYRRSALFDPARPVAVAQPIAPALLATILRLEGLHLLLLTPGNHRFRSALVAPMLNAYGAVHPASIDLLREHFCDVLVPCNGRRLYVSRADAGTRRVLNENAVMAKLAPLGFEHVTLGSRDVLDQIRLFSEAEIVVGPHGAGLGNVVWMDPRVGRVIELTSRAPYLEMYQTICGHMGLRYDTLRAGAVETVDPSTPTSDFAVDAEALGRLLMG